MNDNDYHFNYLLELIDELYEEDNTISRTTYFLILYKLGYVKQGVYSVPEIAELLGVSKNTIYIDYRNIREILKKSLYDINSDNVD